MKTFLYMLVAVMVVGCTSTPKVVKSTPVATPAYTYSQEPEKTVLAGSGSQYEAYLKQLQAERLRHNLELARVENAARERDFRREKGFTNAVVNGTFTNVFVGKSGTIWEQVVAVQSGVTNILEARVLGVVTNKPAAKPSASTQKQWATNQVAAQVMATPMVVTQPVAAQTVQMPQPEVQVVAAPKFSLLGFLFGGYCQPTYSAAYYGDPWNYRHTGYLGYPYAGHPGPRRLFGQTFHVGADNHAHFQHRGRGNFPSPATGFPSPATGHPSPANGYPTSTGWRPSPASGRPSPANWGPSVASRGPVSTGNRPQSSGLPSPASGRPR